MWIIVGLILGAILGGIASNFSDHGVVLGAILGAGFGYIVRQTRQRPAVNLASTEIEQKVAHIYQALGDIHRRLAALEAAQGMPTQAQVAPPPEVESRPMAASAPVAEAALTPAVSEPAPAPAPAPATEPAFAAFPVRPAPAEGAKPIEAAPVAPNPLVAWFSGGNTVVRIGLVILFFGVGFLVKFAAEHSLLPAELRLAGAGLGALVLLGLGWKLKDQRPGYGLSLQGGGIGILYLTVFGAFRLYQFLPAMPAFVLLALIAAASAVLAVKQRAQALAVLGVAGGFLAPVLASTGEGSHVALFSYYALLNAGIFAVAWSQSWRVLNLVGFVFTFVIATLWGVTNYRPEFFATTEPFLLLFYAFYLVIALRYALREAPQLKNYVDATLVFGTPIVGFGLQSQLVRPYEFALALSALALGALYLSLARWLWAKRGEGLRLLVESFVALGIVFLTLTLPLALDGRWTSAAWALEGAAVAWMGLRQQRRLAFAFGVLLQVAAAVFYLDARHGRDWGSMPLANPVFLGGAMIALAGLFTAWAMARAAQKTGTPPRALNYAALAWGTLWWVGTGLNELDRIASNKDLGHAVLVFAALSAAGFAWASRRLSWSEARVPALALPLALPVAALIDSIQLAHPFARWGALAWGSFALAWHWCQRRCESPNWPRLMGALHVFTVWFLAAVASVEVAWWIDHWVSGRASWPLVAHVLVPAGLLFLLTGPKFTQRWPYAEHPATYGRVIAGGVALALWCWMLFGNAAHDGDPWPLPYVPLVNPLDLAQAFALAAMIVWLRRLDEGRLKDVAGKMLALGAFVWANAVLLRAMHFWGGVPYDLDAMLASMKVQTALSLFWTTLALAAMVIASRRGWRGIWFVGAALMAVVVGKLFLVDLNNRGGVERIVSFIGVGLLLLAVGYFSPLPPKRAETEGA